MHPPDFLIAIGGVVGAFFLLVIIGLFMPDLDDDGDDTKADATQDTEPVEQQEEPEPTEEKEEPESHGPPGIGRAVTGS